MRIHTFLSALLIVAAAGCANAGNQAIQASGQMEARQVDIAAELSGRVVEISANEGDAVKAGDPLLRLDDSLLLSQKQAAQSGLEAAKASVQAAQAALDSAQAQYDITLSAALAAQGPSRPQAWKGSKPSDFKQPIWYFSQDEQIQSAQDEASAAKAALDRRTDETYADRRSGRQFRVPGGRKETVGCAPDLHSGQGGRRSHQRCVERNDLHDAAKTELDSTTTALRNAQKDYDSAVTTDGAKDVLKARANVEVARERYYTALDALRALQTGENSLSVVASTTAVQQAQAMLEQAQSAMKSAQANEDLDQRAAGKADGPCADGWRGIWCAASKSEKSFKRACRP